MATWFAVDAAEVFWDLRRSSGFCLSSLYGLARLHVIGHITFDASRLRLLDNTGLSRQRIYGDVIAAQDLFS